MTRDQKIRSLLLLLLFTSPFFMAMPSSSVWDANEAFYVETPREMVESGEWLFPSFNGVPRLNKPPLSYWMVAIFYKLFGVNLLWERLVMALLAAASVFAVFSIGKSLYSPGTALLGAGIFATSFRFLIVSRRLLIDSLVLCCVLVGIALFLRWMKERKNITCIFSAFFFGLAFLAKGPVALFPVLFIGIYCLLPENRKCLVEIPWVLSILTFGLVASSWFLALGFTHGWEPVRNFFLSENIGRFTSEEFGPRRGITYYFGVFFGDFFPWSLPFAGAALAFATGLIKSAAKGGNQLPALKKIPSSAFFLICWCLTYFVIFSFSHNKQEYYILPVYPAASLLLASVASRKSKFLGTFTALSGIIFLILPFLLWFIRKELFPDSAETWWITAIAASLTGACLLKRQMLLSVLGMVFFYQTAFFTFSIPLEDYKPVAPLAETIRETALSGDYELGYYRFTAPSLRFYSDRDIHEIYDLDEAVKLLESSREVYLLTDAEGLLELQQNVRGGIKIVDQKRKISSRLKTLLARLKNQASREEAWSRPVYLVTGQDSD